MSLSDIFAAISLGLEPLEVVCIGSWWALMDCTVILGSMANAMCAAVYG
jgi:hypothetical protein